MDLETLKNHVDARFDKIEGKIDQYAEQTVTNTVQIENLRGFAKLAISIFIAVCGFFALAFFNR